MSIKGNIVKTLSGIGVATPLRATIEKVLVSLGHKYPTNRSILSFCRHFGAKLIEREGSEFERVALFETGGKMSCWGEKSLTELSLFYYFCGTITGQHEDELRVVRLLRRLVRKDDVFFDLGANFGFYSCFVLPMCGPTGAVHAFEANPCLMPHLRRSVSLNKEFGCVELNPVAVGSRSGVTLPLYGADRIGSTSLYPHEWLDRNNVVDVPVTTIDDYVRDKSISRIDVMKIDIEGAELDALRGMEKTFRVCSPKAIICELTLLTQDTRPDDRADIPGRASSAADPYQLATFLRQKGYLLCHISSDGHLCEAPALRADNGVPFKVTNVAFVLPELRSLRPEVFVARS
jgi:FkbM family methyltransferase